MSLNQQDIICYHCGLPVPAGVGYGFELDGQLHPACCKGCEAVAEAIISNGLSDYYHHRTEFAERSEDLVPDELANFQVYDNLQETTEGVDSVASGRLKSCSLILEGVTCAACVWLIERRLMTRPGVVEASVNFSNRRAHVKWREDQARLSDLLQAIYRIGYTAYPYDPEQQQAVVEREAKRFLRRIGVAGFFGMQVMTIAVCLYVGVWSGIDDELRTFLEWVSAGLTLPVVLYSAQPFYKGAIRDLKVLRPGMDVPVSLGIVGAYLASVWSTATGTGAVFYESACMFAGFLLVARYLEFLTRRQAVDASERVTHMAPQMAHLDPRDGSELRLVPASSLQVGDRVVVKPGGTVPADAIVVTGSSTVDESILTGESHPVHKDQGDEAICGSVNLDHPLHLDVTRVGDESTLSTLVRLVERAQQEKPRWQGVADRAASWFVMAVLGMTALTAYYWWREGDSHWLATALSVLVVTCPCAFSLATPTAMAAAIGAMFQRGIVVTRSSAIENLARANAFVFDKTGTLTSGEMKLVNEQALGTMDLAPLHRIVVALERQSDHPIAKALAALPVESVPEVECLKHQAAQGLSGIIEGETYYIGSMSYMQTLNGFSLDDLCDEEGVSRVYLANERELLGVFDLRDRLRTGGLEIISWLKPRLKRLCLFSGDQLSAVRNVAAQLHIDDFRASMKPDQKLTGMRELQNSGAVVAMVGDGVNDAPVLAGADVSLSVSGATQLAHVSSDMLLMNNDLGLIRQAIELSKKTRSIIKQNIYWALAYNLCALPLAMGGYIEPWQAALGMSLSSLIVVVNSYRLQRNKASY